MKQETFYFKDGASSDKEYTIVLRQEGSEYIVFGQYGKRGSANTIAPKYRGLSLFSAEAAYRAEVANRYKKGYTLGPARNIVGSPITTTAAPLSAPLSTMKAPASEFIYPQLLKSIEESEVEAYLTNPEWVMQIKKDGIRYELVRDHADVYAFTKLGRKKTVLPEELVRAAMHMNWDRFILDGEFLEDTLFAFDVLKVGGHNICDRAYSYRLGLLEGWRDSEMQGSGISVVRTFSTTTQKRDGLAAAIVNREEGVVFKKQTASYRPGVREDQVKFKFKASASVIVDSLNAKGKRSFNTRLFDGSPTGSVTVPANKKIPAIGDIVEIEYLYFVGAFVQPVFLGVREDVLPEECIAGQLKLRQGLGE